MYPFPRSGEVNDYSTFNPAYFQHLDHLILELRRIGVQADLILFHPYDKWGYQSMPAEVDDRYLRYVIARFSAFRNVWWSLANEYDLMKAKTNTDWDRYARILTEYDAFDHLRSIHYCFHQYEYGRGWCTHAGVQDSRMELAAGWRADWSKPVVFDECKYEGNIASRWGNLSGDAMTRRFWIAAAKGTYCGHARNLPLARKTFSGGPTAACSTAPAPPKSPSSASCLKRPSPSVPAPSASPTSATIPMPPAAPTAPSSSTTSTNTSPPKEPSRCPKATPTPPNTSTRSLWPARRCPASTPARPK